MWKNKFLALLKILVLSIALVLLVSRFVGVSDNGKKSVGDESFYLYDFAMGTSVSIQLYGEEEKIQIIGDTINNEIKRIDKTLISWRTDESELAKINSNYIPKKPIEISEELAKIIEASLKLSMDSEGALDITIRQLAKLWGIEDKSNEEFRVPEREEIGYVLENSGYDKVKLTDNSLVIEKSDIILDVGAVGKGCALDYARKIINENDFSIESKSDGDFYGGIISVGGSILVMGHKTDGKAWKIGIRNPKGNIEDMLGYVQLEPGCNTCVSTSGDYEKYVEKDGIRYHHILDMKTGYPADSGLSSVTVVCENGLVSDGLSTACFILGYENSLELLKKYDAEAVFVDKDNKIKTTEGISFVYE